jgi:hypothetical protein
MSRTIRNWELRTLSSIVGCGFAVAACSASSADPVALRYSVEFPSKAAAVATERVQVFAFPGRLDCAALVAGYGPPPSWEVQPAAQTSAVSPCALGSAQISLPFGDYTLLAVGSAGATELLIGCAPQTLNAKTEVVPVSLALFDFSRPIPATDCSLADKCAGKVCTK